MKWAFIDYENIGSLGKVDISPYKKVVVFLGAKQSKIDFNESRYDKPIDLVLVQVKASQSNNLDFHLAYYLGKFDAEAAEAVTFDVISNDSGFSPLISHIKSTGRQCKQVKVTGVSGELQKLIQSLTSVPANKRPQKLKSLRNHVAALLRIKGNDAAIQGYLNHLVNNKVVRVSGDSVEYL
ncbi:TPA: PIN domain-containing protein [Vibrio alginolyticus]|jgi:hypothetical protein|uniref:PIN domain-containing protein n=1 Tax=Vibrio alginolyticus TaxID=663 RepID=UPI002278ED98|nr:PIN domain-containing protein [Vibrio alginolyticus]WAE59662.1 PIN domain-containing protein [Vibrio alginolyticus]